MDRSVRESAEFCTNSSELPGQSGGHSGPSTPLSSGRLLSRNANGTIAMTSTPTNESELQLYRVLQRANLLAYYDTFICQGNKRRTTCNDISLFRCDNEQCIEKSGWCDEFPYCSDRSDEMYCKPGSTCNPDIHFECNNGMCIPQEGICDSLASCSDESDEWNCPCEELHGETGNVAYKTYRYAEIAHQKCWKISVSETQFLDLRINSELIHYRPCSQGNITVYTSPKAENNLEHTLVSTICPQRNPFFKKTSMLLYQDVLIRYRRSEISFDEYENFHIKYQKVDLKCNDSEAFKCTNFSCISPEKRCDGHKDCRNGLDEENCDSGSLSAAHLSISKANSIQWMKSQHNSDWGWKGNTHRAVLALHLAGDTNLSRQEDDLIAKQLELEIFTYLLRRKFDKVSSAELAIYINALLTICHDPHNFYGYDLITPLKEGLKTHSSFAPSFQYLTLCNAKEPLSNDTVHRLLELLKLSSPNIGFILELQALAIMAVSCVMNQGNLNQHFVQDIKEALNNIKKQQLADGSFGNEYTTALVVQALIANNQENAGDWNITSSLQFLLKKQDVNGSFGDFMTTYLVMPILNAKTLTDVGKFNCTDDMKRPRDGYTASDIIGRLGNKMMVKYSLFIGDEKDTFFDTEIHSFLLTTPKNVTVLELMTLAAELDPKYQFKTHELKKKKYVYEVSNILNDPEKNMFWFIYRGSGTDVELFTEQSPEKIKAYENDDIILWYRTLNSLYLRSIS